MYMYICVYFSYEYPPEMAQITVNKVNIAKRFLGEHARIPMPSFAPSTLTIKILPPMEGDLPLFELPTWSLCYRFTLFIQKSLNILSYGTKSVR